MKTFTEGWDDYELIDAGGGKKLERWGKIITIRPEVQAYFKTKLSFEEWRKMAHWEFVPKGGQKGQWKSIRKAPENWTISYNRLKFNLELTQFKHVGLFPEQRTNWDFIERNLETESRFLNLFAYTGAASCVARNKNAETFHVDSVKQLIGWAKSNMGASRLMNIKWVHEDALKFAQRELKRRNKYQGIVMDPPAWGIGAKKEKWKLEDKLDELLSTAEQLLTENGFIIVNTYSPKIDLKALTELSELYFQSNETQISELWMKTSQGNDLYFGNLLRVQKSSN